MYVIVMGIIKCEKVFAGIFIFSRMFVILIENKLEKLKITAKYFRTHDTHMVLFSFTQIIKSRSMKLKMIKIKLKTYLSKL